MSPKTVFWRKGMTHNHTDNFSFCQKNNDDSNKKKKLTLEEMELTKAELVGIFCGDENFST